MGEWFSLEGPIFRVGNLIADIVVLSLLWILFSIPLVTIGASTTAMFYVTTRRISNREGYIARDFWQGFKSNFKTATGLWLLCALLAIILLVNIFNIEVMGSLSGIMLPLQFCLLLELAFVTAYVFVITARFDMKFLDIIKTSFAMANRHILTTLACVALAVVIVFGVLIYPLLFFFAMGIYAWLTSYLIMRVFKKYRPEMDEEPTLDAGL